MYISLFTVGTHTQYIAFILSIYQTISTNFIPLFFSKLQDRSVESNRAVSSTKRTHRKIESAANRLQKGYDLGNNSFVEGYSGLSHNNTTVL